MRRFDCIARRSLMRRFDALPNLGSLMRMFDALLNLLLHLLDGLKLLQLVDRLLLHLMLLPWGKIDTKKSAKASRWPCDFAKQGCPTC